MRTRNEKHNSSNILLKPLHIARIHHDVRMGSGLPLCSLPIHGTTAQFTAMSDHAPGVGGREHSLHAAYAPGLACGSNSLEDGTEDNHRLRTLPVYAPCPAMDAIELYATADDGAGSLLL